jgi:hypothetical protein
MAGFCINCVEFFGPYKRKVISYYSSSGFKNNLFLYGIIVAKSRVILVLGTYTLTKSAVSTHVTSQLRYRNTNTLYYSLCRTTVSPDTLAVGL